jgi:tetratricopeptide (TPR) repeat protein
VTIAGLLGDMSLRMQATTYREQLHYYSGDYDRVIELATDNLAASLPDAASHFRLWAAPAIYDRVWIILSLAQLGRFAEAAQYQAEAIRLAERTQLAFNIGLAHRAAGILYLVKSDWLKASALLERAIAERDAREAGGRLTTVIAEPGPFYAKPWFNEIRQWPSRPNRRLSVLTTAGLPHVAAVCACASLSFTARPRHCTDGLFIAGLTRSRAAATPKPPPRLARRS